MIYDEIFYIILKPLQASVSNIKKLWDILFQVLFQNYWKTETKVFLIQFYEMIFFRIRVTTLAAFYQIFCMNNKFAIFKVFKRNGNHETLV